MEAEKEPTSLFTVIYRTISTEWRVSVASIKLLAIEQRKKGLPDACAQCGEPAEEWIRRTGYWTPDWIYVFLLGGLVLVLIVYLIVRKEIRFILPFCEEHKNHWRNRTWLLVGTFLGILGFLLVGTVAAAYSKPNSAVGGVILLVGVLLLLAWVVLAIFVKMTTIRVTYVYDRCVTISGVCESFREAVLDLREERRYERQSSRPRVRKVIQEDDDSDETE